MVDFNGWDMPVEYPANSSRPAAASLPSTSPSAAPSASSTSATWETFASTVPRRSHAVQHMTCNDASRLAVGQAQYSALLYPAGTFVDDVIVHRLAQDDFLLVINAGTREKDFNWVRDAAQSFDCAVENLSDAYTQIAIQGPNGWRTLQKLTDADLTQVKFYWFTHGTVCGLPDTLIARTGYTAEDGFEIYIPSDEPTSVRVWNASARRRRGVRHPPLRPRSPQHPPPRRRALPLRTRNLRHHHPLGSPSRPLRQDGQRRLHRTRLRSPASPERPQNHPRRPRSRRARHPPRRLPRHHSRRPSHRHVTSGSPAPFLKKNIALAYVPVEYSAEGTELGVECRNSIMKCKVVPTPFYKRPKASKPPQ